MINSRVNAQGSTACVFEGQELDGQSSTQFHLAINNLMRVGTGLDSSYTASGGSNARKSVAAISWGETEASHWLGECSSDQWELGIGACMDLT